jgi:polar amino acid transport system substrate-binding protein
MIHKNIAFFLRRIALVSFFALFLCLPNLYSDSIEIAVDESNPPFMYKDKGSGDVLGLYPAIVEALFDKVGEDVSVVAYPWKRLLLLSEVGEVGVAGIYKNSKRQLIYDYSDPIYEERIVVFMRHDGVFPFQAVEDLKEKRIGVIRGWSYGDSFDSARKNNLFVTENSISDEYNFKKLALGRLDCVLAIDLSGELLLQKLELQNDIVASRIPLIVNPTYIAFSKESNKGNLIQMLNNAITELKAEGDYKDIISSSFDVIDVLEP